ncbi:MAG TPA: hypothetical protein VMU18_12920 [Rhodoblastus sp.]|nr:hypothetical protein [Rhodoblastus sp.]
MSEQEIILPPQPRRQDARDLQSRLYREIGLAAVEAALFAPASAPAPVENIRAERQTAIILPSRDAA